ncbi:MULTISPECIES: GNAT family N-acetyltransferase [Pseudomonas]|uniref:GNAT family N-acetyltransferase n=1 Tax=Pseudomonas quercus TaxID=2722792 RepID=A0ABX0YN65_9PSED|nr:MULTISPECIES: GNAT family N-acetyltransferase [Pseudomonas]MBF7144786.1 GNAT family N-acetyltransferase [Pseudomonas sp. LY10J]NJP03323.1 GNAT family N-acetyltransferase [Pseudomonas quercus]
MVENVYIRELQHTDAPALLAFEQANRAWFDAHIEARPPSFYSLDGVAEHIDTYLQGLAAGTWHPFVLCTPKGDIVGRANLKAINQAAGEAEVGYRIAQQATRQGLATLALEHLMYQARVRWALHALVAWVFDENRGSRRVLERCGFHEAMTNASEIATRERRFVYPLLPLGDKP